MTALVSDLNNIWCEPEKQAVTFQSFIRCFEQKNREDELFLRYIRTLDQSNLKILLNFITGKKRLPLCELGEEQMSVTWRGEVGKLPIAQNCTNTLIIPADAVDKDVDGLAEVMKPIFRFNTIYGFS